MPEPRYVDPAQEAAIEAMVARDSRIGVDTEFVRERTYFAELCLVQFTAGEQIVCADALGLVDDDVRTQFWEPLMRPEWVLHSARQDIEVVYQSAGVMPRRVLDTQIAAALVGYPPQMGYASLVAELFDVELPKSHTRADWSKRPLKPTLLEYAAEDVQYLLPAWDRLAERLEAAGRLDWAIEDSAALLDERLYVVEPSAAIERVKGAGRLTGQARAALAALAAWREKEALSRNRPRQWILRDPVLVDLALRRPSSQRELGQVDGLPDKTRQRHGSRILELLAGAGSDDGYRPPAPPDEAQKRALKQMQRRVARVADELGIAAELLAPKKELSAAMLGARDSRVFNGWRRDVIGAELEGLLESG